MVPPGPSRESIQVTVNGNRQVSLLAPATVQDLVAQCQPRPPFAVELNQRLVSHRGYGQAPLGDGDRVEIVELVGGG